MLTQAVCFRRRPSVDQKRSAADATNALSLPVSKPNAIGERLLLAYFSRSLYFTFLSVNFL